MDCQYVLVMFLLSCTAAETEPTENGTALLQKDPLFQEAPPAVRSPVQSSQQATAFLVSGWNDLSTWRPGSQAVSVCEEDIEEAIKGYIANQMWALQVFDSWAKPGPSLLEGRSMFVGNYHQCRGIRSPAMNARAGFGGNYCVVYLANLTTFQIRNVIELMAFSRIQLGTCLPDSCSEEDITLVFQERLEAMNLSSFLFALSTDCLSEEREFTTFTKVALVIIVVIVMLVMAGTGIELTAQFHKLTSSNQTSECQVCEKKQEDNTQRVWVKVLLSFSMYTNGKRLLSTSQAPGSIAVIPGLRFLTMSWIVIGHAYWAMIFGRAGPVSVFLSWSPFTVLGRLTYTGYLIQLSILEIILENLEQPPYLNIASVIVYGAAALVFTCAVSTILVCCVEMPTLNLEKIRDHKRKL